MVITSDPALILAGIIGVGAVLLLALSMLSFRRRAARVEEMLGAVSAGLIVLSADEVCRGIGGSLRELLEMPDDWDPTGLTITEILTEFTNRGDFGPHIPAWTPVDPEFFRSGLIEDVYLETPRGRVVSVAITELSKGGSVLTFLDMTGQKEQTRMLARARRELEESETRARE
ncbi:MAG TPA: PAS-domain containing protein, partial [Paracoccaceae bacterium]|nr:PAS-domain containing protein [Paracoccaceae bacterium]